MPQIAQDRRANGRYELRLALHYHVSLKGVPARSGSGTTCDISTGGLSFRCRKPLPVGAHIEIMIDWPAKYEDMDPVFLQVTGFIIRSDGNRTVVRVASHKFKVTPAHLQQARASA